jgi:hypothetical protein
VADLINRQALEQPIGDGDRLVFQCSPFDESWRLALSVALAYVFALCGVYSAVFGYQVTRQIYEGTSPLGQYWWIPLVALLSLGLAFTGSFLVLRSPTRAVRRLLGRTALLADKHGITIPDAGVVIPWPAVNRVTSAHPIDWIYATVTVSYSVDGSAKRETVYISSTGMSRLIAVAALSSARTRWGTAGPDPNARDGPGFAEVYQSLSDIFDDGDPVSSVERPADITQDPDLAAAAGIPASYVRVRGLQVLRVCRGLLISIALLSLLYLLWEGFERIASGQALLRDDAAVAGVSLLLLAVLLAIGASGPIGALNHVARTGWLVSLDPDRIWLEREGIAIPAAHIEKLQVRPWHTAFSSTRWPHPPDLTVFVRTTGAASGDTARVRLSLFPCPYSAAQVALRLKQWAKPHGIEVEARF